MGPGFCIPMGQAAGTTLHIASHPVQLGGREKALLGSVNGISLSLVPCCTPRKRDVRCAMVAGFRIFRGKRAFISSKEYFGVWSG